MKKFLYLVLLIPFVLTGCGTTTKSTTDDTDNTVATHNIITVSSVFTSDSLMTNTNRMSWSPDGNNIAFEASDFNVYRVPTASGSTPVKGTNYTGDEDGGEAVAYMVNGDLAYYQGWLGNDYDMHIMCAGANQVSNSPTPSATRSFNGDTVGMGTDHAGSPVGMVVAGCAFKAVITWESSYPYHDAGVYLLDWTGDPMTSTLIANAIDATIDKSGGYLAYQTSANAIICRTLPAGTEVVVTANSATCVSISNNGKIGFLSGAGYCVYDIASSNTTVYAVPAGTMLQNAELSPDGKSIAFRTFSQGGPGSGISIGKLID